MDFRGDAIDDVHRAFLQAFISNSCFTVDQAKGVLASIISAVSDEEHGAEDITENDLHNYIATINAVLSPLEMEIRSSRTQNTPRETIWALINTVSDPAAQLATTHSADEIAFVKRLLDHIFETNNTRSHEIMGVTAFDAIKLHKARSGRAAGQGEDAAVARAKDLSQAEAESMLETLVDEGWFDRDRKFYTLSARGLMELRGWLLETYNDPPQVEKIKLCQGCKEIVTIGQRCQDRQCPARLHDNCVASFFRSQRNRDVCPLCSKQWKEGNFVGARAALRRPERRDSEGAAIGAD